MAARPDRLLPAVRYVVTTRPGAIADGALAEAGFTQAALEPMSPPLARMFIGQWHAAIREGQDTDAGAAVAALPRRAAAHAG